MTLQWPWLFCTKSLSACFLFVQTKCTITFKPCIYRSTQEKSSLFAFTPRTKILKRELSRRKLSEISCKFAQTISFSARFHRETPGKTCGEILQTFAEFLCKILRRYSSKTHLKKMLLRFKFWFCLICGSTSQSTAMVRSRQSINLTTLFLGRLPKR